MKQASGKVKPLLDNPGECLLEHPSGCFTVRWTGGAGIPQGGG